MKSDYSFVVVGGGIAGVSCVEALEFWAPDESILMISASPCIKAVTNALQLTKTLLQFDVEEQTPEAFKSNHDKVDVILDTVVSIDSDKKLVYTVGGNTFGFKTVCLAMGGQPKLIDTGHPLVFGIRDTDSVIKLKQRLSNARRIVVVGNGGIATELMYEVAGLEKIWVIKDKHISSTFVDAGAAEFLKDCLTRENTAGEESTVLKRMRYTGHATSTAALGPDWHAQFELKGMNADESVKIEYGTTVLKVEDLIDADFPLNVVLDNGNSYHADLVISATGVIPCTSQVQISPVPPETALDGGIVVNECMESSVKGIYAAGDVASAGWPPAQHWHQMRLWTQARQMGQYAGRAMAYGLKGERVEQDFCFELFSHVTKFFGFKVILLGLFNGQKMGDDYELLLRVTKGKEFIKLVLKDGKIQGAILIGETDLEEMCENLILDQLDVSPFGEDLLNPDIDIEDYFD